MFLGTASMNSPLSFVLFGSVSSQSSSFAAMSPLVLVSHHELMCECIPGPPMTMNSVTEAINSPMRML